MEKRKLTGMRNAVLTEQRKNDEDMTIFQIILPVFALHNLHSKLSVPSEQKSRALDFVREKVASTAHPLDFS